MKKSIRKNQKGSALLLTLGILSLALILAMSFAFSARTNRQVSKINADQIKAKLFSESCVERVMASMKYNTSVGGTKYYPAEEASSLNLHLPEHTLKATNDTVTYTQHYATIGKDKSDENEFSFESILLKEADYVKFLNDNCTTNFNLSNSGFQTVMDKAFDDPDSKVIGRIGFLLLEESSKFDINSLLTLRQGMNNTPFVPKDGIRLNGDLDEIFNRNDCFLYCLVGTGAPDEPFYSVLDYSLSHEMDESTTLRLGQLMQEIRVGKSDYSLLPKGYANKTLIKWFSYNHLRECVTDYKDDALAYTFFSVEEPEAFLADDGGTLKEFHRFDITGYEWGDRTLSFYNSNNEPISTNEGCGWYTADATDARNLINDLRNPAKTEFVKATVNTDMATSIPFLATMVGRDGNRINPVDKQVAANMIDFCDSDSAATIDPFFDFYGNEPGIPEYCGNEKVAYFNEIAFRLSVQRTSLNSGQVYSYKLKIQPHVEFANIFKEQVSAGNIELKIWGTLKAHCGNTAHHDYHYPDDQDIDNPVYSKTINLTYSKQINENDTYAIADFAEQTLLDFIEPYSGTTTEIVNQGGTPQTVVVYLPPTVSFKFNITRIIVQHKISGKVADLGFCDYNEAGEFIFDETYNGETIDSIVDIEEYYHASIQAEDPRCNHLASCWQWANGASGKYYINEANITGTENDPWTLGANNFNFKPGDAPFEVDLEEDNTSLKFSTAYIKDAPFESFWELGCIHRGEPYRTINLTKFTASEDAPDGTYEQGDAAMLDQVKIGPVKYLKGKFNPNSRNIKAYKDILFKNINLEDHYDAFTTYNSVLTLNKADWHAPTYNRGALAKALKNAATYKNDREAEALLGRSANLLSTRSDAYTLIVIAQAMKEFDDPEVATLWSDSSFKETLLNPTKYHVDGVGDRYCSILSTQAVMLHIVRDSWTNEYKIVHTNFISK